MANKRFMDERDWSALPGDVINVIFRKLFDFLDFVRFRAVCKAWCSAASLSDLPMYPWLLKCQCGVFGRRISQDHLYFYSFSSNRTGRINIKDSTSMRPFRGPTRGYLLHHELGRLALFNPLTKETMSLPYQSGAVTWPILTGVDSSLIPDQNIIVINRWLNNCDQIRNWSFYDLKSKKWISEYGLFSSYCYFQGRLFCIDNKYPSCTMVYDVSTRKKMYEIKTPDEQRSRFKHNYLVESAGVLLGVTLRSDNENDESITFCISTLHFGEKDGQPHWGRITSIGDQILFLDYRHGFSRSSAHLPELKGNCIYFTYSGGSHEHGTWPYKYDIALSTVERLECPFACCSWFVPCLE